MGIMLIDASAEGQQDTDFLNVPPQATPAPNGGKHTPIGLQGMKMDQWHLGSVQLGGRRFTQVCSLEHFP